MQVTEKKSLMELLSIPGQDEASILEVVGEADIDAAGAHGYTPLMLAVIMSGEPEIVRALLDAGVDVDARTDEGMTALMWALQCETFDMAVSDAESFAARERNRLFIAAELIRRGASVNVACRLPHRYGWTPLHFALLEPDRNAEIVFKLLAAGADPNARTADGGVPLCQAAARAWFTGAVHDLIRAGADVDGAGNEPGREGWTPLFYALARPRGSLPVVKKLIAGGAQVNRTVGNGYTPLLFAAGQGNYPAVRVLLAAGADPRACDGSGSSAFDYAMARNASHVARLLR